MKIARDKAFERLIKLKKGKVSQKITTIRSRHKASLLLSTELVEENGTEDWTVTSASNKANQYHIKKESVNCTFSCCLHCDDCNICIHQYSCTCPDHLIYATICKHIHLVIRYLRIQNTSSFNDTTTNSLVDDTILLNEIRSTKTATSIDNLKDFAMKKFNELQTCIRNSTSEYEVQSVCSHLLSAINISKALKSTTNSSLKCNISHSTSFHSSYFSCSYETSMELYVM